MNKKWRFCCLVFILTFTLLTVAGTALNRLDADPELIATDGGFANLYTINSTTGSTSLVGTFTLDC